MILRKVSFLLFLMLGASAALGSSETAFETFKGFEGKWAIRSGQETLPIEMTYESGSKGSFVTEQFGKELSVFYRDGQSLLMTQGRVAHGLRSMVASIESWKKQWLYCITYCTFTKTFDAVLPLALHEEEPGAKSSIDICPPALKGTLMGPESNQRFG